MLYNDFRPTSFDQVIGQPSGTVLRNMALRAADPKKIKSTPHAILMSGKRGVGKTTLARLFAQALNCSKQGDKFPCGKCRSCRAVRQRGGHPDIIEVDSATSGGGAQIQSLVEQMQLLPTFRRRVCILDEAQMLSKTAMAMLLKVIEEPSRQTVVVLLTTEPDKIDAALRSRCMWLALRSLDQRQIARLIAQVCLSEKLPITRDAVLLLARFADGSARDALSVLEALLNYDQVTVELVESVVGHRVDVSALLQCLNNRDVSAALVEAQRLCERNEPGAVIDSMSYALIQQLHRLIDKGQPAEPVIYWIELFQHSKADRSETVPSLPLELAVVECARMADFIPPPAIMMNDVEAFAAFVQPASKSLAERINQLEFVRIKKGTTVLFRTTTRPFTKLVEGAIEHSMQKYLRDDKLRMEILYA